MERKPLTAAAASAGKLLQFTQPPAGLVVVWFGSFCVVLVLANSTTQSHLFRLSFCLLELKVGDITPLLFGGIYIGGLIISS